MSIQQQKRIMKIINGEKIDQNTHKKIIHKMIYISIDS